MSPTTIHALILIGEANVLDSFKIKLQYGLPKLVLTRVAGWGATKRGGWLTKLMVKAFVRYYRINMEIAKNPDLASYLTFNEFFVRSLRENVRPIVKGSNWLALPADGIISQLGQIHDGFICQAKGHFYNLEVLLGGNSILAQSFRNGLFATTYLAPGDYHRVHMPCAGVLSEMIYVPGKLFSVNPCTVKYVPNLFARNERVICVFNTNIGPLVQILVGATIVGSIETVWAGSVPSHRKGVIGRWTYPSKGENGAVELEKGAEMGRFKLGSTVINLFIEGSIQFSPKLNNGSIVHMGEAFAKIPSISEPSESL